MKLRREYIYIATAAVMVAASWPTRSLQWQGSTQLHTIMETVATVLAFFIGLLAFIRYYSKKTNIFLFISTGFIGAGLLDGYHAIVTSVFFTEIFPSPPPSLLPWSWVASRFFLSISLWLSWLSWRYESTSSKTRGDTVIGERLIFTVTGVLTIGSFLLFAFVPLPTAHYPNLMFHRPQELVPALFFLAALVGYLRKGYWRTNDFEHWLVLSLIVCLVTQVSYMSFSGRIFDGMFDAAHMLKKAGYICVLIGLAVNMFRLFREVEDSRQEIITVNEKLREEITQHRTTSDELRCLSTSLEQRVEDRTAELERSRTGAVEMMTAAETARKRVETVNLELKHTELELERYADELERSNAELEQFAYVASHDLKAPLRAIENLCEWIREEIGDSANENCRKYFDLLFVRTERMKRLLEDLLAYSRVGRNEGDAEEVDVCALIDSMVDLMAPPPGIRIVQASAMPVIETFRVPLEMIFRNLIGNAIKHHDKDKGEITITAEPVERGWFFAVADNGPGIEEAFHQRIFEMFVTLKPRDEVEGSGMGLAMVKKIIDYHKGEITVASTCGAGTVFRFVWPATSIAPPRKG